MQSRQISVAVIGHSFVSRAYHCIRDHLGQSSSVYNFKIFGRGGMIFNKKKKKFRDCIKFLKNNHFDLVIVFLGDNDLFKPHEDTYDDMRCSNIWGTINTFMHHLTLIKLAANAKVSWVSPAVRQDRPNYNSCLSLISYEMTKRAKRRRWLRVLSREDRGGSDASQTSDGIHPRPDFYNSWILEYITHAIRLHLNA